MKGRPSHPLLRIGTRDSALALTQARLFEQRILSHFPQLKTQLCPVKTTGDMLAREDLSLLGGKGLFVKELEMALMEGTIDVAVHSLKDMPAGLPEALEIGCVLPREDAGDAFLSRHHASLEALPEGATIGTSSLRRAIQAKQCRPDIRIVPMRGNVDTRIRKLKEGQVDATFLAVAGIKRLALEKEITAVMDIAHMVPAVGQGAIAIESRKGDKEVQHFLQPVHHEATAFCVYIERAFLQAFGGDCTLPVAAYARVEKGKTRLSCFAASLDGATICRDDMEVAREQATELAIDTARKYASRCGR